MCYLPHRGMIRVQVPLGTLRALFLEGVLLSYDKIAVYFTIERYICLVFSKRKKMFFTV